MITGDDIRKDIDAVRRALRALDAGPPLEQLPPEGIRDLAAAVDAVRQSTWALLKAQHKVDYVAYIGKVRVDRASDACEDVLSDLRAGAVTQGTPELEVFHATLHELASICRGHDDG